MVVGLTEKVKAGLFDLQSLVQDAVQQLTGSIACKQVHLATLTTTSCFHFIQLLSVNHRGGFSDKEYMTTCSNIGPVGQNAQLAFALHCF